MELLILIPVAIVIAIVVMPFIAMAKAGDAQRRVDDLTRQINTLERQLRGLIAATETKGVQAVPPKAAPEQVSTPPVTATEETMRPAVVPSAKAPEKQQAPPFVPARPAAVEPAPPVVPPVPPLPPPVTVPAPPKATHEPAVPTVPAEPFLPPVPAINWEQFMGAKLFAWVGGIALFFGIAFFVRYSFENNLIPPEARVAIGFLTGVGLLVGGVMMKRKETAVTAQTLCSTGVLVLYGVTFACYRVYKFPFFGPTPTFLLMSLITVVAFLLSVRLNALAVAVLGIAGGFLTPILLSTGQDAPLALFGYIALLDIGLLAVSLRQRWNSLPVLGAIGTTLMQIGWTARFFVPEKYFAGHKVLVAMAVFAGFEALFLAAAVAARRFERGSKQLSGSALVIGAIALLASFFFLTFPTLGHQPLMLFGYVFIVDLGLLVLVLCDKMLAASESIAGVMVFVLLGWWSNAYLGASHLYAALGFYLLFALFHLAAPALLKRLRATTLPWFWQAGPALALPFFYLALPAAANHPVLLFGTVFLVTLGIFLTAFFDRESAPMEGVAGIATFVLLGIWTGNSLSPASLHAALAFYFVFAVFHSAAPLVLHKVRGTALPWWSNAFPALSLILVMMPVFKLPELSLLIWPLVLLIDLLAVVLSVITALLLPILVVLVLTLLVIGAWILRIPAELTGLPTSLFMLGGFAVFFIAAATFASRRLAKFAPVAAPGEKPEANAALLSVQIPAMSAVLPFLLLIMLTLRLPLANPSPVFGLALLLVVLLLGLTKILSLEFLPAIGLASVAALEHAWHFHNFKPAHPGVPMTWYLVFYFVFSAFPFLFHRRFARSIVPWAAAAVAGPLNFYLLLHLVRAAWPGLDGVMGLLPAAFSIPALAGTAMLLKRTPAGSPARNSQLAWFGGVALFFITLIFPIQFDREWITIGWALEGAALCWLFHRVPHPGLRLVGVALLVVAFTRLGLNPMVLDYHTRAATPVFNWYLYAYGITILALFAGAKLLAPPRNRILETNVPPLLHSLGTVLAFLLVNIEIADFFSAPGAQSLVFEFSGSFARDMSYSIAWALFALLMLVIGIWNRVAAVRYAGIGLLAVTLLKLFFHDLLQLDQLYRIAAFIIVAVIAIFASFLYQHFLGTTDSHETTPKTPAAH